ncbi:MAG TPA: VOC family protein [Gemmataceae bacterium]|nr:VOC family protein [Gemmataceae bacterium]
MPGHTGLIPHLVVKGAAAAIDFYKAAFGAVEEHRMAMPGSDLLLHASLKIDGNSVFLCDDFPDFCGGVSRAPSGPASVTLHICVADADATFNQAVAAGAKVSMPIGDMFWGDRYGTVTDPFGHSWSFSTPLSAERHAKAQKEWEEWQAQQGQAAA